MRRSFLILQGPASPFFRRLAEALRARGHIVRRVNFCGGDFFYSGRGESVWNYVGPASELPGWYADKLRTGDFTDVVMFGDCREIHRHIHPIAQAAGLRVHVFEEGYVRPHWLTLEQYGVNGRSRLPRDPQWYLAQRPVTPASPPASSTGYSLIVRGFHDVTYRIANSIFAMRFPHYRSHRPRNGFVEYSGLAWRGISLRQFRNHAQQVTDELLRKRSKYYFFPLQLDSDTQIIVHSPFDGIDDAIRHVITSFTRYAPNDTLLVIKNHPLDTGLTNHYDHTMRIAWEFGATHRIHFLNSGHLPTLLGHAHGVVVVNSTVGLSALHHRRALVALGDAIYDMPGLTWQAGIDTFWETQMQPDEQLYQAFLDYVVHHTQVNGNFYTRPGIGMAIADIVRRLETAE